MRFKIEKLLIFLAATRIILLILPWLASILLSPDKTATNLIEFTRISWNRWDALHYTFLAEYWYTNTGDPANFIVFFPLYPLLLKLLFLIFGNPTISGILLSTILFLLGSYYFYKLVEIDYGERLAGLATTALAIFPTSYFFNAPYTESLFLLVFSATMYAARKENWILAGILTGFAVVTRPFGILLLPAVLVEWWFSKGRTLRVLPILFTPALFAGVSYLYLNTIVYGNPFEFEKILAQNWQKNFVSPFLGILSSWKIALTSSLSTYSIMVGWAEAITITISWVLIPFAFKFLRKSWAVFYTLSIILFSSTSFILSTPRYFLSIPPIFILIALAEKNKTFKTIWQFTSISFLIFLTIIFTQGQWAF